MTRTRGLLLGAALLALGLGIGGPGDELDGAASVGSVPFDGRSPQSAEARRMRVLVELLRPSLAELVAADAISPRRQREQVRSLEHEARALQSSLRGEGVDLDDVVTYARTWNGFAATIDSDDLPALQTLGVRTHAVHRFYPAAGEVGPAGPAAPAGPAGGEGAAGDTARAAGGAAPTTGTRRREPTASPPEIALLDSGVDVRHPDLRGRVVTGFDAVGAGSRAEGHGTALAGVLAAALPRRERLLAIRVAGAQRDPGTGSPLEFGTTDQLLAGVERAVDPDGDGDAEDAVPVVVVGVNAPYAGFSNSPEAEAADAAGQLGTLVVAPAGNEGEPAGGFGTVGSPGAAPGVLAVAALEGRGAPGLPEATVALATRHGLATLRGSLLGGGGRAVRAGAAALIGASQADPGGSGRGAGGALLEYFSVDARPRARGRVVFVPARDARGRAPAPSAQAAAALAAGASGLVICEPDARRAPLPVSGLVRGGLPVVGLSGPAARRALELTRSSGGLAAVSAPQPRDGRGATRTAAASSRGPSYDLSVKPDLAAPGTAVTALAGGGHGYVAGTSVAAARAGAAALAVWREGVAQAPRDLASTRGSKDGAAARTRQDLTSPRASQDGAAAPTPQEVAAALTGTASGLGPVTVAGAGQLDPIRAARPPALASPRSLAIRAPAAAEGVPVAAGRVSFRNPAAEALTLTLRVRLDAPGRASVEPTTLRIPPGATRQLLVRVAPAAGRRATFLAGRVLAADPRGAQLTVPFGAALLPGPPARLGTPRLVKDGQRVTGVRFSAGSVLRKGGRVSVEPVAALELRLLGPSPRDSRELTPPGGAGALLPGEYAYTMTRSVLLRLAPGRYRFELRARPPARGPEAVRRSAELRIR